MKACVASPSRATRRGFTLVEVLVTLVLMGIVLPIALGGISVASEAASVAKHSREAASLAESKLNELIVTGQYSNASLTGDFGADWPAYHWIAQSTTRDMNLMEVTVQVIWTVRGADRQVALTTLVYTGSGAMSL